MRKVVPILIGFFVVAGFVCLLSPQRFIAGLDEERTELIEHSSMVKGSVIMKSQVFAMPTNLSDLKPYEVNTKIESIELTSDSLIHFYRLYRNGLVARAP